MLTRLSNTPRDYAWGSPTLIPALEGRAPTGSPEAEVWFGDHPGSPARVTDADATPLNAWLPPRAADLGVPERLPYLLKLLAAGSPLSIQVHPSLAQAREGFAREEEAGVPRDAPTRTYRDDNHKPELLVAVSERFDALAGLRDLATTRRLVAALGDGAGPRALAERLAGDDAPAALRRTLAWLLGGEAGSAVTEIIAAMIAVADRADAPEFAAEWELARTLAGAYPGDPGVVVALLMNLVSLRRGEALFVPAGVLHAYVAGLGVEIMAASDNVLRGGLTPKHVDVDELLRILDTTPAPPPVLAPAAHGPGVALFAPPVSDFALAAVQVTGDAPQLPFAGTAIVLAVAGAVEVSGAGGEVCSLRPGEAVLATPAESPLRFRGEGTAYVALPGSA